MTAPHWCCSSYLQIRVPIKSISIKFFLHLFQCKHNKASDYQSQPKNTSDKWATVIRLAARTVMTTALVKGHPASCYHQCSFNNKQRQKGVFIVHSWLEMIPWWNDLFKGEKEKWIVCKWVQSLSPWVRCLKYLTSFILFTCLVKKTNLLSVCSTGQQQGQRMMMM